MIVRQPVMALVVLAAPALSANPAAAEGIDGPQGRIAEAATYRVAPDGTVDWRTYNGFRRDHAECHVCHGPDGEGSTIAPPLLEPLRTMSHAEFRHVVAHGMRDAAAGRQQVMRPMGGDPNVMCHLDDIYAYLKARADGVLPRGRPNRHEAKPRAALEAERSCLARR
jgi:methanol metabolism-related c-type cytochrome